MSFDPIKQGIAEAASSNGQRYSVWKDAEIARLSIQNDWTLREAREHFERTTERAIVEHMTGLIRQQQHDTIEHRIDTEPKGTEALARAVEEYQAEADNEQIAACFRPERALEQPYPKLRDVMAGLLLMTLTTLIILWGVFG